MTSTPRRERSRSELVMVVGAIAPSPKPVPQRVGAKGQSDCAPDIMLFGKGQQLGVRYPASPWEKALCRAVADDTLGELVVRRLSRGQVKQSGVMPYIPCMKPLNWGAIIIATALVRDVVGTT